MRKLGLKNPRQYMFKLAFSVSQSGQRTNVSLKPPFKIKKCTLNALC